MRIIDADEIDRALEFPALINALGEAFRGDMVVPVRHHHAVERKGDDATLLLMPAWTAADAPLPLGRSARANAGGEVGGRAVDQTCLEPCPGRSPHP